MFVSAGKKIGTAATTFSDTRAQGQKLADQMNDWHSKNSPGGAFADAGGFGRNVNQGHANPFGGKSTPLTEDPLHPANFKAKINRSQQMVEEESMKDFPRKVTYGLLTFFSGVTIMLNLVQEDWNPWKYHESCPYEDYTPNFGQAADAKAAAADASKKRAAEPSNG
jgi:hypothetical protein